MYTEINKAHILFDKFDKNTKHLNGIINLSEALLIISDILNTAEDNGLKIKAHNLGSTIKNFIVNKIKKIDLNPSSYTYDFFEYWDSVLQEFIDANIANDEEISNLQKDLNRCKEKSRWESLSEKEQQKEILSVLNSLSKEEIEELRNFAIKNKKNTNS